MAFEKALALSRVDTLSITRFVVLTGIIAIAPFSQNQILTGSIVNATLFIGATVLGIRGAILLAVIPSFIALSVGTLPFVLAPIIPFIILSNILLVLVYSALNKSNFFLKVFSASVVKFIFLSAASTWAINLLFKNELLGMAAKMLSWPQLLTALIGGGFAYFALKGLKLLESK